MSCLSIPSLCVRSPETSLYPESHHGEADLAMRSLPTVDVEETRRCMRQRRSDSSDYQTPDAQLVSDMCISCIRLETFRPIRNNGTLVIHRVMLLPFSYVVPRSAVASAQIDLTHMPRGVSSRQNCRDLSDSPGHVSTLLLLLTACFHGSWPYAHSFAVAFDVPEMMRNVRSVESSKAREALGRISFAC